MSSILGNGIPQFIGTGIPDTTTRILHYGTITELSLSEKVSQVNESMITHERSYDDKGRHATVVVTVNLDLYDTNPLAIASLPIAKTFFDTLMTYEHRDVKFYLSTNGPCFKNIAGSDITLHLANIEINFAVMEGLIGDRAILTFMTNELFDLSRLAIT